MRLRLASLLGAVLLAMLGSAPVATAGNWATSYLDPLPDTFRAGQPYTVGYWVLQHGSHVSSEDLGTTALVFTPAEGAPAEFPGVALREPARTTRPRSPCPTTGCGGCRRARAGSPTTGSAP
ncbi:hypothetical protein ACWEGE_01855 [Amycolatopsis sp. NPDC004747]